MVIADLIEELDLLLLEQQSGGDGVDGSIAPSFVEETALPVHVVEVVQVSLGSEPVEASNFKVRPLVVVG